RHWHHGCCVFHWEISVHAPRDLEGQRQLRSRHDPRRSLRGHRACRRAALPPAARQGREPDRLQARVRGRGRRGAVATDFIYLDQPYYLAPQGEPAAKSYALLRDSLARAERVGVGTFVLRQREHLGALEPVGDALVLTTLRFAHEIRTPDALDLPRGGRGWDKREMALALQLIDALAH